MAAADAPTSDKKGWPVLIGWGAIALFAVGFTYFVTGQLGEGWAKREQEAVQMVKNYKPDGGDMNLSDLTKNYSILAKEKGRYVGEFAWDGKQRDNAQYEVTLLWKEGETRQVAVWVVDLSTKEVRPQGDAAGSLPKRARAGGDS